MIEISARITKDGQPVRRFRLSSGRMLSVMGTRFGFRERQMYRMGNLGISTILERVSKAIGSDDSRMKPLSMRRSRKGEQYGYRVRKRKAVGGRGIRDLRLTGAMLDNLSVRSVSETEVRIDFTSRDARMKARTNEARDAWWGWSPKDLVRLTVAAKQMFREMAFNISATRDRGLSSSAIWMDPMSYNFPGSVDARWARGLRQRISSGNLGRKHPL